MISVEEKLSVFTQYLLKKQRETGKAIIDAAKEKKAAMLAQAEQELQTNKHNLEERNYHVIYRDKNKIIAQGKNIAKNQMLEQRSVILEDFKRTIWEEARNFMGTPTYTTYLENCLKKVPQIFGERKTLIVYAKETDLKLVQSLVNRHLSGYAVTYEEADLGVIGGIIVRDTEHRINCDFTMANLVRDNSKQIGMRLNEMMDKQVVK